MKTIIIGCGGVGSWLVPVITRLLKEKDEIILIDKDRLESKNLDRQLFSVESVGHYKAEVLAEKYGCEYRNAWYSSSMMQHGRSDILFACVDNHPTRVSILEACDRNRCRCIIAANETHSAEAYYYQSEWQGTHLDPRVFYPEILADKSGDPRAVAIGCTGEAQQQNPQLATANFMAAALALNLYVVWVQELKKADESVLPHLPHRLSSTLTRLESHKTGEEICQIMKQ